MKKSLGANPIIYPTPVLIVGTYDAAGKPNVMTAAWGGICCSSPPLRGRRPAQGDVYLREYR